KTRVSSLFEDSRRGRSLGGKTCDSRPSLRSGGGHDGRVVVVVALVRELAAELGDSGERPRDRAWPRLLPILDTVGLARGPDLGRDLPQAVGRQARKQVMLDLPIERAAKQREQPRDRKIVGRLDLHRV